MNKRLQCKNIPDRPILEFLAKNPEQWHNWSFRNDDDSPDTYCVMRAMPPGIPDKLVIAKMGQMIRRGVVDGCDCGCRGDYVITEKGIAELAKGTEAVK